MRDDRLLTPGQTCWRVERASQFTAVIDAADYFRQVKAAMLRAQHRIILIGWDFDARMTFERGDKALPGPNQLGAFLYWLLRHRPTLEAYLLRSNLRLLPAFDDIWYGITPVSLVNRLSAKRMHFAVDGAHPIGAVHHQKIVVIDDALAFCGGIDLTLDRWDTPEHKDNNPFRRAFGRKYGPRHDVAAAMDGSAARALAELGRDRWLTATDKALTPIDDARAVWPGGLKPVLRDVDIGIARTLPEFNDRREVREVEALNLAAIAAARHTIYFENQYLAARNVAEAIAARLKAPDGPEVVVVLPRRGSNRLEQQAMDSARHRLIHLLWDADETSTFRRLLAGDRRRYTDLCPLEGTCGRRPATAHRIIEFQQPVDGVRQRVRCGHRSGLEGFGARRRSPPDRVRAESIGVGTPRRIRRRI